MENLTYKLASAAFALGMIMMAFGGPKGPPSSPSAQLAFPFVMEKKVHAGYPTYPYGGWVKPLSRKGTHDKVGGA